MKFTTNQINRKIFVHHSVPVLKADYKYIFPELIEPTPLIYAIVCEQAEILEYFLETTQPDLSISCNGWKPIHFASYCKDPKILRILLRMDYIQQNVDAPIIERGAKSSGRCTTALHIAVSNHRHAQALLLTQSFPAVEFGLDGKRILSSDSPIADDSTRQPANPIQLTTSGNAPLHIAAFTNDWDMCQILLNVSDDNYILNCDEKTPIDIARERGYNELAQKLEENDPESVEELMERYLSGLIRTNQYQNTNPASREAVDDLKDAIAELEKTVKELNNRLSVLEKH